MEIKRIKDMDFIEGGRYESYILGNDISITSISLVITKDGETRRYDPITFLNLLLEKYYIAVDELQGDEFSTRLKIIFNAKREIIHYIEEFKEILKTSPLVKRKYDYSDIMKQVEVAVKRLKLDLDLRKYEFEVKKLENETKWYKEDVFCFLLF